jgi:hypothetical protein
MAAPSTDAPLVTLSLSEQERTLLLSVLDQALREKRIEVHRTDALEYREHLEQQEALLNRFVERLRQP